MSETEPRGDFTPTWRVARRPDTNIHYLDSGGTATPIVLLHGLAGHAGEWLGTMRHLHPRRRTLAIDQRGHGRSTRLPADLSREAFANDFAAVIDAAAVDRPVVLIGQSMGAHTAFIAAACHPHLVSHLVMIEGDVGGGGAEQHMALRKALSSWPVPFPDYETAMHFFGDNELGRAWADGFEQRADGLWPCWDIDVMVQTMKPIFERECWNAWQSLSQPTLLVQGDSGWIDRKRVERMLATRPGTRRVTIAAAGHDVHLQQPAAWFAALDDFLNECSLRHPCHAEAKA